MATDKRNDVLNVLTDLAAQMTAQKAAETQAQQDAVAFETGVKVAAVNEACLVARVRVAVLLHAPPDGQRAQRWFVEVGTGTAATALCGLSGGIICAATGFMATVIISTVQEFYNPDPKICLEIELYYSGCQHSAYPTYC